MKRNKKNIEENISPEEIEKIHKDTQSLAAKINDAKNKGEDGIFLTVQELKVVLILQKVFFTYLHAVQLLQNSKKAVRSLKNLFFGKKNESSKNRDKQKDKKNNKDNDDGNGPGTENADSDKKNLAEGSKQEGKTNSHKRNGGGGKNPIGSYRSAIVIPCRLPSAHAVGCLCPECKKHKLYSRGTRSSLRLVGMAPVMALRFEQDLSECICGAKFSGIVPEELQRIFDEEKYTSSALSSIFHSKFDLGVSFGGLEKYQEDLGCPLPVSTQSNQIREKMDVIKALYKAMIGHAVNRDIVGFDDTNCTILEGYVTKDGNKSNHAYGSVFVFRNIGIGEKNIVIYTLNFNHAGKDFLSFLNLRDANLAPPIAISDGLPAYQTYKKGTKDVNCQIHGRRQFFNEDPQGQSLLCNIVIDNYKTIYKNEGHCKSKNLNPQERLLYHEKYSKEALDTIFQTCRFIMMSPSEDLSMFREELGLPEYIVPADLNSDLYKAAKYFFDRENQLKEFLKTPGVPLDTNLEEQMIKKLIKLKKQSLFFKTLNSAEQGSMVLSLIQTAKEYGVSSFDYLQFIFANQSETMKNPNLFMPWNYQVHPLYKIRPFFLSNLLQTLRFQGHHCLKGLITSLGQFPSPQCHLASG